MILLAFFFAAAIFSGCKDKEPKHDIETDNPFCNTEIIPPAIGQCSFDNFGIFKHFSVIKTEKEWEYLKNLLNHDRNVTDNFTETDIDFSQYQIIFVVDERIYERKLNIDATDIEETADSIIISVSNKEIEDTMGIAWQPFQVVKIPASDKPVVFKDLTLSNNDDANISILPISSFSFVAPYCYMDFKNKVQRDTVYLINSHEEFEYYFTCENTHNIDFSKKTVLMAYGGGEIGFYSIKLYKTNNVYRLSLDFYPSSLIGIAGWNAVVITDKINTDTDSVELKLNFYNYENT